MAGAEPAGQGRGRADEAPQPAGCHLAQGRALCRDHGLVFPSAVGAFLDAGVQHLIVELADEAGPESIALAAKARPTDAVQQQLTARQYNSDGQPRGVEAEA
jgi:hypothetical protein